jgi:hypothetical protein
MEFTYRISGHELERVEEIMDLGVILDTKMTFSNHIESIIAKSTRMLRFIKRIDKALTRVKCKGLKKIQHNFIRFAHRRLH